MKHKGGRNLASFQEAFVCLICSGWVTFLTFDLLSKHQMPRTGLSYRVNHSSGWADKTNWGHRPPLQHRSTVRKERGRCTLWRAPCFIQAGNSHLSSSFRRDQKELLLDEPEPKSIAIFFPTPLPSWVRRFVVTLRAEQKVVPEFSVVRPPSHGRLLSERTNSLLCLSFLEDSNNVAVFPA